MDNTLKGYIQSQAKKTKKENHHLILHIRISLGSKFQIEETILIFQNNFPKHGYFLRKTEKINVITELFIFELVYVSNFTLNKQFNILRPNLPKTGISSQTREK